MHPPRRRPHFAWYFLGVLPAAAGIGLAVWFFLGMLGAIDGMKRVRVPGAETVELAAGDYVVFAEGTGGGYAGRCALTGPDGAELSLGSPTGKTTYQLGGREGVSVFEFTAPRAGAHRLACEGEHAVLAIGHGIGLTLLGMILAPIGGMLLAGVTVVLVYLWRRRRS